jgi:hypothetical protein
MDNFDLRKYLAEGRLLKEDDSLDSKLNNLEGVYDSEPQISTAVFNEEGFYLTPLEIDDIKDTAQDEYSEYQNQEKMIGPEASSIIKKFKKEVTPEIWKKWVEYNDGDDRIAHILNLFNEMYNDGTLGLAEGRLLKEDDSLDSKINEADETLMGGIAKNLYLYLSKMKPNNPLDTNGQPLQNVKGEIIKNDPKVKMIYQNASTGLNNLAMQGKAKELEKSHQGNQNNAEITIWYTSNAINALGFVKKEEAEAALKVIVDKYPKEVTGTVNTNKMDYEWAKNYAPEYSIYITMKSDKELARTQSARPQAQ